jgi:hypothetical protein
LRGHGCNKVGNLFGHAQVTVLLTQITTFKLTHSLYPEVSRMADDDVFAAMGIVGFGKATKKRTLDPARFDKNKRDEVGA